MIRQTRVEKILRLPAPSWMLLLFLLLCLAEVAPSQASPGTALSNPAQAVEPPTVTTPVRAQPEQSKAPEEVSPKSRQTSSQPSSKPLELTDFQQFAAQSLGYVLPIYGAALFDNVPTTFAPVDRIPVTANYVIGPGDELLIRAWGQIDLDIHARVDRNGAIYVPKVGNLNVAGLRYDQVQDFLKAHIGRIYQNFDLNVTMGELRSIDVYVVGQARRPGRYTISSLSTLANAIFASGGPATTGSMRHIELKRGKNVVTDFDLYDLLLK